MKMGRRLRCSSVTSSPTFLISRLFCLSSGAKKWGWMRPPNASPARTALPAAHFDRNESHVISGTGH
jgi:hypothetical protein